MNTKRIVFMGTPEIAATVLAALHLRGFSVVAAFTGEDKVRGRGKETSPTDVKRMALSLDIPVYTPRTLRDAEVQQQLKALAPDLIVVVAYGKLLPAEVLAIPPYGCVNVHVSLLPKYRGAAPMQRAIMEGERMTGVSLMQMDEGLDTGDVLAVAELPIRSEDTLETIHDASASLGAALLCDSLPGLFAGTLTPVKQEPSLATYAAKITKEDCHLCLSLSAKQLDCIIRGLTPVPLAFVYHNGKKLKIWKAEPAPGQGAPGQIIALDGTAEGSVWVACGQGALKITALIPEGKGLMSAGDYIRGRKIQLGDVFS